MMDFFRFVIVGNPDPFTCTRRKKAKVDVVPDREIIHDAYEAAYGIKREASRNPHNVGPFSACKVWAYAKNERKSMVSGAMDMSLSRKNSNYSRWEMLNIKDLRREAQEHHAALEGTRLYKLDGNKLEDLVCIKPPSSRT